MPLFTILGTIVLLGGWLGFTGDAHADVCRRTPWGIDCGYSGRSTSTTVVDRGGSRPPLRYLATSSGRCWYWSRYPPGLDSWDSANDHAIIFTRFRLPRCRGRSAPAPRIIASERAWQVFRSFPLDRPDFHLRPEVGITNLPSLLRLHRPEDFEHSERLPDGRILEVEASVRRVWIAWGDGAPVTGVTLREALRPNRVRHTYGLKTCPADYRTGHIDGGKCHPHLEAYPVTVTFEWRGRYRDGRSWREIGTIDRAAVIHYDVDEVLGVLDG